MVNMGQGFFGYNRKFSPMNMIVLRSAEGVNITAPEFVLNAARDALNRVECNQYSPTKVYICSGWRTLVN